MLKLYDREPFQVQVRRCLYSVRSEHTKNCLDLMYVAKIYRPDRGCEKWHVVL